MSDLKSKPQVMDGAFSNENEHPAYENHDMMTSGGYSDQKKLYSPVTGGYDSQKSSATANKPSEATLVCQADGPLPHQEAIETATVSQDRCLEREFESECGPERGDRLKSEPECHEPVGPVKQWKDFTVCKSYDGNKFKKGHCLSYDAESDMYTYKVIYESVDEQIKIGARDLQVNLDEVGQEDKLRADVINRMTPPISSEVDDGLDKAQKSEDSRVRRSFNACADGQMGGCVDAASLGLLTNQAVVAFSGSARHVDSGCEVHNEYKYSVTRS